MNKQKAASEPQPAIPAQSREIPFRKRSPLRGTVQFIRSIIDQMLSATSGFALLWVGWVVLVFFAVIGLLRMDGDGLASDPYSIVLMALLGQSAVVTGIGLASIDHMNRAKEGGTVPLTVSPPNLSNAGGHNVFAAGDLPDNGRPKSARQGYLYPDGSIEVETLLGPRRFSSVDDVFEFVGRDPSVPSQEALTRH